MQASAVRPSISGRDDWVRPSRTVTGWPQDRMEVGGQDRLPGGREAGRAHTWYTAATSVISALAALGNSHEGF